MPLPRWDGHVHTQFAPHGAPEPTEQFLERALALGFERVTLVEHAPLPPRVRDPLANRSNNMPPEHLAAYLAHAVDLRDRYADRLEVRVGLEVDLLPRHHDDLRRLVETHDDVLDEVICSVHLLPDGGGSWGCLGHSAESFGRLARRLGSVGTLRRLYFETLAEELDHDACAPLPRRVGHLLLVDKFRIAFPEAAHDEASLVRRAVAVAVERGYSLDLNSAGLRKPRCRRLYLRGAALSEAVRLKAQVVFGSDARRAEEVGAGWTEASAEMERVERGVR
jgi:histidinol-phosphatase (PHP family)